MAQDNAALAAEVLMTIPHRGWTSDSTYFITASVWGKKRLFQAPTAAELFVEVLYHYRGQEKYLLHEFVVMPNHFHLLITPAETLERSLQLIKGGFSFRAKRELGFGGEIWQTSFYDHRVRDAEEYARMRTYIHENPVRARLVSSPELYPYSSANLRWVVDEVPQRLKPQVTSVLN
jgi:putative transposase